jgi:hypothetical protein
VVENGWLIASIGGDTEGIVPVPAQWLRPEQVDWEISGEIALTSQGLQWVEIWNIYP